MKTLNGLKEKPELFDPEGRFESRSENEKKELVNNLPTFRQMILKQIGAGRPPKSMESIISLQQTLLKVRSADGDSCDLENSDFKAMKEACLENAGDYAQWYQAQLIEKIQMWEKESPSEKK